MKYVEKHYGEGNGQGKRILNPTTNIILENGAIAEMEMVQIKGVDSTLRQTTVHLAASAKLIVTERLLTHGAQKARSNIDVYLDGADASAQIVSRSVAKDKSEQVFYPRAVGNNLCKAHVQCDSIIMDSAKIRSIPEIAANHSEAQIVHEAAIGRINIGQGAYALTGGYVSAVLVTQAGFSFWATLPLAGLACAAVAVMIGLPILRLRGVYFAMVTLVLTEVARLTAPSPDALSGTRYAAATVTAAGGFTPRATERANRRSGRYRLPLTTPSALLMTVR